MELTWSTFILEIINFLVLVWVLKRFFYAPVRRVIDQRREAIEQSIAQAEGKRAEAKALEDQYQSRLAEWEQEKKQARERLQNEMAAERERLLAELNTGLDKEKEKRRILDERRAGEFRRHAEEQALSQGARFAARILAETAGQDVQDRLLAMLVNELPRLSEQDRAALGGGHGGGPSIKVTGAYPLNDAQRLALEDALKAVSGAAVSCEYREDPAVIAGVRISAGALVLRANVQDELQFFGEVSNVPAD
ncbi:MAG TPA: F0F1 ATP synthase subunit delta [Gammaproteobacteria bacterium]|nr:F0F1 ATP synthase subunit delta [Gammaproteobacteria bacterium]